MDPLDSPDRHQEISSKILGKPSLKAFYSEIYARYADCLTRCPADGAVLELGSGAGFAKQFIPELLTSDTIPYPGLDLVADGTCMPFADNSLRMICMINVLHHIPDPAAFFAEAVRCLKPGGRLFITDQNVGPISSPVHRYLHHEPFDPKATEWGFPSSGPLSGANGAQAWIIFKRDRAEFEHRFPALKLLGYTPHSPLRYWAIGGLKAWCLIPGWAFGVATWLDRSLCGLWPNLGSFVDIELAKKHPTSN